MPRSRVLVSTAMVVAVLALACDEHADRRARTAPGGANRPSAETTVPVPSPSLPGGLQFDKKAWQELWRATPGSPDRRCVAVDDRSSVRSGEFVAGNFASYRSRWDGTLENSKLFYIPLDSTMTPPLMVTAETVGAEVVEMIQPLQFLAVAWSENGIPFYSTGTVLPYRGSWRLVAQAGPNWGCFELTV